MLKTSLFKNGDVNELNKAADVPLFLHSNPTDVIVMELCGKDESVLEGLRIIATCKKYWPQIPLVVCTLLTDLRFLQQIISLGVASICHKFDPLPTIHHCIESAIAGAYQDSPTIKELLTATPLTTLTGKEIDVLSYLLAGCTVTTVALMMHRNIRTISTHKRNAMTKLGYRNDSELFSRGKWLSQNGLFN